LLGLAVCGGPSPPLWIQKLNGYTEFENSSQIPAPPNASRVHFIADRWDQLCQRTGVAVRGRAEQTSDLVLAVFYNRYIVARAVRHERCGQARLGDSPPDGFRMATPKRMRRRRRLLAVPQERSHEFARLGVARRQ